MHSTHIYDGHPQGIYWPEPLPEQQYMPGHVITVDQNGTVTSAQSATTPGGKLQPHVPYTGYGVQPAMTIGTV